MADEYIHKMNCPLCKEAIEFKEDEVGVTGLCPACAGVIHFKRPPAPMTPRMKFIFGTLIPASAWIAIIVGGLIYFNTDHDPANLPTPTQPPDRSAMTPVWETNKTEFGDPILKRPQLPAGAWAATLVPFTTDDNLYRDPGTGKKYRVKDGEIVEETSPYAGLSPEAVQQILQSQANIAKIMADSKRQAAEDNRQAEYLYELRRANNIADQRNMILSDSAYDQRQQGNNQWFQNQQALQEIQRLQLDYEYNSLKR